MNHTSLARLVRLSLLVGVVAAPPSSATNGMALSGYGPVAASLGGASQAYYNGNFGAVNNPATLSLMDAGGRLEVGANVMHVNAQTWDSGERPVSSTAEWFVMPNISYMAKDGNWSYGIGGFSQGGLGADYGTREFLSRTPLTRAPTGLRDKSQLMIGRLIVPMAVQVSDRLSLGGSVDLVYGRLTVEQSMPIWAMLDMMLPPLRTLGVARLHRLSPRTFGRMLATGLPSYGHMDFQNLDSWGYGGQVGLTFKASDTLTLGASYQLETRLADLEGDAGMQLGSGILHTSIPGKARIDDFQWPATLKIGVAYRASDQLLLVADVKRYYWSDVLDTFKVRYAVDGGGQIDVDMNQKWKDQTVYSIGGEYTFNPDLKLRAGFNYGKNPIPSAYLQHLGEAIAEYHLMLGAGWKVADAGELDLAYTHTFKNTETNSSPLVGLSSSLSQDSLNLIYSHRFGR